MRVSPSGMRRGSRIFPAVFAFGVLARCAWVVGQELHRRIRSGASAATLFHALVPRRYVSFFTACAITVAALVGASVISDGGLAHWRAFSEKIALHNQHLAGVRVGFRSVFLMQYAYPEGGWPAYRTLARQTLTDYGWLLRSFQTFALIMMALAVRRADDHDAAALGYVPAFFLTAPTFYYQVMVLVPLLFFLSKRDQTARMAGAAGVFGVSIVLLVLNQYQRLDLPLAFTMACLLLALCIGALAVCALGASESAPPAKSPKASKNPKQGNGGEKRPRKNAPRPKHEFDLVGPA